MPQNSWVAVCVSRSRPEGGLDHAGIGYRVQEQSPVLSHSRQGGGHDVGRSARHILSGVGEGAEPMAHAVLIGEPYFAHPRRALHPLEQERMVPNAKRRSNSFNHLMCGPFETSSNGGDPRTGPPGASRRSASALAGFADHRHARTGRPTGVARGATAHSCGQRNHRHPDSDPAPAMSVSRQRPSGDRACRSALPHTEPGVMVNVHRMPPEATGAVRVRTYHVAYAREWTGKARPVHSFETAPPPTGQSETVTTRTP